MDAYLWLKALHLISMTAWMAGLFYLPRLFVYHAGAPVGSATSELFKLMEVRLLRVIINPAMIATLGFGFALIWVGGGSTLPGALDYLAHAHWLHGKLLLVVLLLGVHGWLAATRKRFSRDERRHSAKTFRIINEIPTVLLIGIVLLAVLKPF